MFDAFPPDFYVDLLKSLFVSQPNIITLFLDKGISYILEQLLKADDQKLIYHVLNFFQLFFKTQNNQYWNILVFNQSLI